MIKANRIVNLNLYIVQVLKQIEDGMNITEEATDILCCFLCVVGSRLVQEAVFIVSTFGKISRWTLDARAFQTATRSILPEALARHAVCEGLKHTEYKVYTKSKLVIPTSLVRDLITPYHSGKVKSTALVFLIAVLEYLCAEILELSGKSAKDNNRNSIQDRDIKFVIGNDEEIAELDYLISRKRFV
jgi:histone H3/H4